MVKIILCCSAGMSTSLFVQKTKNYAEEIGEEIDIIAISVAELDAVLTDDVSIVLLAPQIRFQKDSVVAKTNKPVVVIEMRDYGMMNVQKVLPEILKLVCQ
ncbi:MAG: PTS sugar transporter subunit IIB [Brevinema sp.]